MSRISERELILPSLHLLFGAEGQKLTTTDLIIELRNLLNPQGEDLIQIEGRADDKFSQKVRNLRTHRTLEKNNYTSFDSNTSTFSIEPEGIEYLNENIDLLHSIVAEEKFLSMYTSQISNYYEACKHSLNLTENLISNIGLTRADDLRYFYNMLYSSIITALETYLFDALKVNITKKKEYLVSYVENNDAFNGKKFILQEIFTEMNKINETVEKSLITLMYHNLPKVKTVYNDCFGITLPDYTDLMESISIRHDLVHRNGKTHAGVVHNIGKEEILTLNQKVLDYVEEINNMLETL